MLAAVPLAVAGGSLAAGAVAIVPAALAIGAVLAVVAEAVASRFDATVRRVWARRSVQAAATAGAVLVVAVVAFGRPGSTAAGWLVSAAAGGLGTYLAMLGAVTVRDAVG